MNEVTQRRIIGLSVILAALFILSLLLPQGAKRGPGDAPVAEVRVDEAARYDPAAAPAPPASTRADIAESAEPGFKPEPPPVQTLPPPPPPPVAQPTVAQLDDKPAAPAEASKADKLAAAEKPAEIAAERTSEKAADKPLLKPAAKPADKPIDKPVEKPIEKPIEKPAEKIADKAVLAATKPEVPRLEPGKPFTPVEKPAIPIAKPAEAKVADVDKADAKPAAPAAKPAAGGRWYVQIGSYAAEGGAQTTASLLRNAGYSSEVGPVQTSKGTLYRVRVGPYASAEAADAALAKLKLQGYPNAQKRGAEAG